jgi:signal transduction histidine kinase
MKQLSDFFRGLFSTSDWPARWHCGQWSDFHGWLYIVSDWMIWLSYFLIPVIILNYFYKKKEQIRYQNAYLLFALFILFCGATHFFDSMMFWIPMYRLNALLRFFTAVVSLLTVYYLIKMLPVFSRQKTNVELETEIGLRRQAEQRLREANESLEAFASVASHDLQEPLRKISTFSHLLKEHNHDILDHTSRQYADKIIQSSKRMQSLVQDILTLSSLNNSFESKRIDLSVIIRSVTDSLELKIRERKAKIVYGHLPAVTGNETYLFQVFYNLINNALKFSTRDPRIEIKAESTGTILRITVADNGIGVEEEYRDKIFEAFQRVHSRKEFEGTGLGLAICKKIVDLHRGSISVENNPSGGSIFVIDLPA